MTTSGVIQATEIPASLLSDLDQRQAAVWLRSLPDDSADVVEFLNLPWRMAFLEVSDEWLLDALDASTDDTDPKVQKRGFVHVIDRDPSQIQLPQRCLPIYLLNGRDGTMAHDFQGRYRRMAMLEVLRRSEIRQLVITSSDDEPIPPDLKDLWQSGLRTSLLFVSDASDTTALLADWADDTSGLTPATLPHQPVTSTIAEIITRYNAAYPDERLFIRLRNRSGDPYILDVTDLDDPERPLLDTYSTIQERDLATLAPDQISEEEFVSFFQNPDMSWRPYAAGLPWQRDDEPRRQLRDVIKKIETGGSDESCIAYVLSEPGAGGTTLVHALAWDLAQDGYPVLVARQLPFVPDALPVANYLNRTKRRLEEAIQGPGPATSRYEVPWIIVFDRVHWEYRATELRRFRNEMQRQGRSVCLLVVTGPMREMSFFDTSAFREIAELNHALDQKDARDLGRHLNRFLRVYGKERKEWQWDDFYEKHTVKHIEGWSSFWITLSFWIQGQYDLTESIQEWMYRSFGNHVEDTVLKDAILDIAAMSSERFPLPDGLLPRSSTQEWPTSHLLNDSRSVLGPLGLVRATISGDGYWALVHDILGRFLITALFYDFPTRSDLGFADARSPDHLRFLLLRRISRRPELGERWYRDFGDEFAKTVFKIDPDHGRAEFAPFWREVLDALDAMNPVLGTTSRVFRHHSSVSRRRIAKLPESAYGVTIDDKIELLNKAVKDLEYALHSIEYTPGSETNLNLYNSLSHAYHDLAEVEESRGSPEENVRRLRSMGSEAARKAHEESPTNSFVVETYVRDLLATSRASPADTVECVVRALGVLYSAMSSNEQSYRRAQLGTLADDAVSLLLQNAPTNLQNHEPRGAVDVLMNAWMLLADGVEHKGGVEFLEIPRENRIRAIDVLSHSAGRGNMQVVRLSYDLVSSTYPQDFRQQIEFLDQLAVTDYRISPQLRLEHAVLLYQNDRPMEGDKAFRSLRRLWREGEHYVQVPKRMHWLIDGGDAGRRRIVQGTVVSDLGSRAMAGIREFGNVKVPFRAEEFGLRNVSPGESFRCCVSFGHNGPFLRPVTAA